MGNANSIVNLQSPIEMYNLAAGSPPCLTANTGSAAIRIVRREPRRESKPQEKREYTPRRQPPVAPKTFNMPGFREVVRCKAWERADRGGDMEP